MSVSLILIACEGANTDSNEDTIIAQETIEEQLQTLLNGANTDTDFTLMVESNNGTQFIHNRGASISATTYR